MNKTTIHIHTKPTIKFTTRTRFSRLFFLWLNSNSISISLSLCISNSPERKRRSSWRESKHQISMLPAFWLLCLSRDLNSSYKLFFSWIWQKRERFRGCLWFLLLLLLYCYEAYQERSVLLLLSPVSTELEFFLSSRRYLYFYAFSTCLFTRVSNRVVILDEA